MERVFVVSVALFLNCSMLIAMDSSITQEFNAKYMEWKEYINRPEIRVQSTAKARIENPFFAALVAMGTPALPCIAAKMEEDPSADVLWHAIEKIAKVKISGVYDKTKNKMIFPDYPTLKPDESLYLQWWKEGRFKTGERFAELHGKWKSLKSEKKDKEAEEAYQRIVNLGIPVLPYLVDNVERHPELIVAISKLTDNALPASATVTECKQWWDRNKTKYELPPPAIK